MTKILVIRFSSIGDIVLTSPILRCIKDQLKNVELHTLTKEQYGSLYASNPYVDKVHLWHNEGNEKTIKNLKKENFDFIIDLHHNLRTTKVKTILMKKSKSFPKANLKKWLLVNFKWNIMPNLHVVDRYFRAIEPLGVKNDNMGLDFYINIDYESFKKRFKTKGKYIVVAIGAKFATKRMPSLQLSRVIENQPLPIVLIGGPEDRNEGERIKQLLPNQEIDNTCGEFSFHESAQIIKDAALLITHDTGMMHIGSAFDLPVVSIWGNTVPAFGMYPYRPQRPNSFSIHEVKNLDCRPCSKIGFRACPKKHFKCMLNHDIAAIRVQIAHFLEDKQTMDAST